MLRLNAPKKNRGFTLAETLVIAIVIGIATILVSPSLAGAIDRVKLNQAVVDVRGALQESQRQAIRSSEPCTVTLNKTEHQVTGSCLMTGNRTLPEHIALATNILGSANQVNINFGILGTAEFGIDVPAPPPPDPSGKIVLFLDRRSIPDQKCIVISNTLGLTRAGNYTGSVVGPDITASGVCAASAQ